MSAGRWRSKAAKDLVAAIQAAGGTVERTGRSGKLVVTGPKGKVTITEPQHEVRRDLRRFSPTVRIREATGLNI